MGIMSSLKIHKKLASKILMCGKRRIWLDPHEIPYMSRNNTRRSIHKLIKKCLVMKSSVSMHSRSRKRRNNLAKSKGRHSGNGKRVGTSEARLPSKTLWIRHMRVVRHLLRKYRDTKNIDRHSYHSLYLECKANKYRNKRKLIEALNGIKKGNAIIAPQFGIRKNKMLSIR